jgi:hypothetical protein
LVADRVSAPEHVFALALAMTACATALDPAGDGVATQFDVPAWGALVFTATVALLAVNGVSPVAALPPASATALLVAAMGSVLRLFYCLGARSWARQALGVFAGAAATAPLWLGPIALRVGSTDLTNAIVAVSPLSFLAVACRCDYLRCSWFYARTPVGSIRFEYPDAWAIALVLMTLALGAGALAGSFSKGGVTTR